ncbi:MAG: hypothetical protein H8E66_04620 [Planctomycetes bacterium]|nr:hypothetical protein [Planctomycetota bacterium]
MPKSLNSTVVIGTLYTVFLCALVSGSVVARQHVLKTESSATSQEDWQDWRSEAQRQQAGSGPVSRRVPKSSEPPSLVLLRDHFATSLTILVVLSSALFFTIAIMVRGVLVGPSFQPDFRSGSEEVLHRN